MNKKIGTGTSILINKKNYFIFQNSIFNLDLCEQIFEPEPGLGLGLGRLHNTAYIKKILFLNWTYTR